MSKQKKNMKYSVSSNNNKDSTAITKSQVTLRYIASHKNIRDKSLKLGAQLSTETTYEDNNYDDETNLVWGDDEIDTSNIDHTNDSR